jgi:hypothetical protein
VKPVHVVAKKKAMFPLCVGGATLILWEWLGGIPIGRDIRG